MKTYLHGNQYEHAVSDHILITVNIVAPVARHKVGSATVPTDQFKFTITETFKINQCASVVCLFK